MIDFRPGRREIVTKLVAEYAKICSPFELGRATTGPASPDNWDTWIKQLFVIADKIIKIDLETEGESVPDRPKY